jgi:hypothetical protein
MAKQRVQVQELDAGSLVVRPTASPVDTYVRPASEQPTLTPLSQFVNAISPAVEAKANEMKTEKLKLERKEEAYKLRMQDAQAKAKMGEITLDIDQQYNFDSESFHEKYPNAQLAIEAYNKPIETYLEKLRQDPTVDQSIIQDMEYYAEVSKIAFATTYNTNQLKINRTKVDNNFINQVSKVNQATNKTPEQQVEMIQTLADQMANGFLLPTGKPDYKRFNTLLVDFLHDTKSVNADSPLYEAVSNMVTKDGNYLNILNSAVYADKGAAIEQARATLIKASTKLQVKQAEEQLTQQKAETAITQGDAGILALGVEVTHTVEINGETKEIKLNLTKANITQALYMEAAVELANLERDLANSNKSDVEKNEVINAVKSKHYKLYEDLGIMSPDVREVVTNFSGLTTSDVNVSQEDEAGNKSYPALIEAEQLYKMMENIEAYSGTASLSNLGFSNEQIEFYSALNSGMEANYTFRDSLNTARKIRENPELLKNISISTEDLGSMVDTGLFDLTNLDEVVNLNDLKPLIEKRAAILMAGNNLLSEEDAIIKASKQIAADYVPFKMANGQFTAIPSESLSTTELAFEQLEEQLNKMQEDGNFKQMIESVYNLSPTILSEVSEALRANNPVTRVLSAIQLGAGEQVSPNTFTIMPRPTILNKNMVDLYVVELGSDGKINPSGNIYKTPISVDLLALPEDIKSTMIGNMSKEIEELNENLPSLAEDPRMFIEPNEVEKQLGARPVGEVLSEVGDAIGGTVSEAVGAVGEAIGSAIESISQSPDGKPLSSEEIDNKIKETFEDLQGSVETPSLIKSTAASTIIEDEGFSTTPYDDMGKQSVGHGLQIESLEPDERALIKDINNVQPEESQAVVALKVDKISNYFSDVVEGFQNLPETAQSAMVQMGYQLGQYNVTSEWTEFMKSIKEAATYTKGSIEQATALAEAKFHMLYNEAKDGTTRLTKWATQTKDRAFKVASELGSDLQTALSLPKPKPTKPVAKTVKHGDSIKNMIPSHMRMFIQDILDINLDTTRTNDFLSKDEFTALQEVTRRAMNRQGGTKGDIDYDLDYTKGQSDVSFLSNSLSIGDPEGAIKKTLGDFTWSVNDKGEVIITDQYNFNDALKLRKKYDTEIKKLAHLTALAARAASGDEQVGLYGLIRRYGALYGSVDGQGAKFEINLGKL